LGAPFTDDPPPWGSPDLIIAQYFSPARGTDYDALAHTLTVKKKIDAIE